jgi:hypothetical protein
MKVGLDGGAPTMLAAGLSPGEIAVDATNVYWIDGSAIMKGGVAGGATPVALAQPQYPVNLALDASYVYWVDGGNTVMRVRIDGGPPELIYYSSSSPIRTVAVDASGVYWSDQAGNISVGVTGQTSRVLVSNASFVLGLALDASSVYWIGGSSIYRTPK